MRNNTKQLWWEQQECIKERQESINEICEIFWSETCICTHNDTNCDGKSNVQNVLVYDANWNGECENEIMFLTLENDLKKHVQD